MIEVFRGKTVVQEEGKVRVFVPHLSVGTSVEVEVVVLPVEKAENVSEDQNEKCADRKD